MHRMLYTQCHTPWSHTAVSNNKNGSCTAHIAMHLVLALSSYTNIRKIEREKKRVKLCMFAIVTTYTWIGLLSLSCFGQRKIDILLCFSAFFFFSRKSSLSCTCCRPKNIQYLHIDAMCVWFTSEDNVADAFRREEKQRNELKLSTTNQTATEQHVMRSNTPKILFEKKTNVHDQRRS